MEGLRATIFPGAGAFTGVMTGSAGGVAFGSASSTRYGPPALVWTSGPELDEWWEAQLEGGNGAIARAAAVDEDGMLLVGARLAETTGEPAPTVWVGTPSEGFRIVDVTWDGEGYLESVAVAGDRYVVTGQAAALRPDRFGRRPERAGRVLVGVPGEWIDVTPPGTSVVVSKVLVTGDEWVAVGGAGESAVIWRSPDEGATWETTLPGGDPGAVVTDIVGDDDGRLTAVATAVNEFGGQATHLFRSVGKSWERLANAGNRDMRWIIPVSGGVAGGPGVDRPLVVTGGPASISEFGFETGWTTTYLPETGAPVMGANSAFDGLDGFLVGTVGLQPAFWTRSAITVVPPEVVRRHWQRLGPLSSRTSMALSAGDRIVDFTPELDRLAVTTDGAEWESLDLPDGFDVDRFAGEGPLIVAAGTEQTGVVILVIDADNQVRRRAGFPGDRILGLHLEDGTIVLFYSGSGDAFLARMTVGGDEPPQVQPLPVLPEQLVFFDDGLIAGTVAELQSYRAILSTDGGVTWQTLDVAAAYVVSVGGQPVAATGRGPTTFVRLDPGPPARPVAFDVDFGEMGDNEFIRSWADGLYVFDQDGTRIRYLPRIGADIVDIPLTPAAGFDGVIQALAPDGLAVATESGEFVLYRWLGTRP